MLLHILWTEAKTLSVKHTIDSWHLFRSAWYKSLHICMQINSLQWKNRLDSRAFWHCVCVCHISFHLPTIKIGMGYTKMTLTLFINDRKAIYYILLAHEKESTIESWKAGLIFPCQNSWSHFELWQTVPWCLQSALQCQVHQNALLPTSRQIKAYILLI